MADQSTLQTLLQQGVGLQSNAQNNTAMTPNNGNPNTIYNLAAPNVRQFNPATGSLPAMGDANGNWAVPAQGLNPALQQILSNNVQQTNIRPTIPSTPFVIPPVIIPSLPSPAPTTPPVTGPTPWTPPTPAPGSNVDPNSQIPPEILEALSRVGGGSQTGGTSWDSYANPGFTGSFGGTNAPANPTAGWGNGMNMAGFLQGAKGDTGGTILELLDKVSEPFLPGDMVQGGNFNWRQAMESVANQYGIPIEQAANLLGKGDQYRAWVSAGYGNLPGDARFGTLATGNTEGYNMGQVNPITGQLSLGLLNPINIPQSNVPTNFSDNNANMAAAFGPNWNAPVAPRSTAGTVAGASAITGDAAREMFENMRLAAMARGERQTGADTMGRPFSK